MKNYTISLVSAIIFSLVFANGNAQNTLDKTDDLGRIALTSYVSNQIDGLPSSAKSMLKNKLNQIATKNGLGGNAINQRFIITPNIVVLTKDITPTAPPMIAMNLEFTFYIGDGFDGIKFSSESIEVKGVGTNENKAYIAAIKQINPNNPAFKNLVDAGKIEIIEYYNSRCDYIIKEAQTLEAQSKYEAAIFKLTSVPEVCKECFNKCMDQVGPIYQKHIDKECKIKLQAARNSWSSSQNYSGAQAASRHLAYIDPNASCFGEAQNLTDEIANRMLELDQRAWDFKLKKYQDQTDLRKATIRAARDIGVAYGNNQPQNIQYHTKSWW